MTGQITKKEFLDLFDHVSNWGRWGPEDALGTLNLLTPAARRQARTLIQDGNTLSLAREITSAELPRAAPEPDAPLDDWLNAKVLLNRVESEEAIDFFGVVAHGTAFTHIDALTHLAWEGRIYNGHERGGDIANQGTVIGSVAELAHGIVGRGVLLDVASVRGVDAMTAGEAFTIDDLERAERLAGVNVGAGDSVFVRTGMKVTWSNLQMPSTAEGPGPHPEIVQWLHDRGVAVFGSDTFNDAMPAVCPEIGLGFHMLAIVRLGLWIVDNAELERLAQTSRKLNRWEFLISIAPPPIAGATGALVNPIATF